jgi:hypothetical protein
VNLQPFLLTHAQTGALAPDALSAVYDRTAYTD